jgi:hypothetical protein
MIYSDYYDLAYRNRWGGGDYCFPAPITGMGGGKL